jgi:hypothetical protein
MPVGRRGIGGNSTDSDGEYIHVWEIAEPRDVTIPQIQDLSASQKRIAKKLTNLSFL